MGFENKAVLIAGRGPGRTERRSCLAKRISQQPIDRPQKVP